MSKEAMKLSQDLRTLADRFSEGWHDGIKIDASDIILLTDAAEALASEAKEQSAQQESVNKYCCHLCFNKSGQVFLDRMILCPKCGNKRCPKATHHGLPCTKSNDLGQKGSIYDQPLQQEPVERGGLRFYTNGTERQHWKADGSIDFKDKQGNVTMTIAAGSITSPQPSKPLTDEEIWKFWCSRPEVPYGEDDSMEAEFVAAVRRVLAALGIKENT